MLITRSARPRRSSAPLTHAQLRRMATPACQEAQQHQVPRRFSGPDGQHSAFYCNAHHRVCPPARIVHSQRHSDLKRMATPAHQEAQQHHTYKTLSWTWWASQCIRLQCSSPGPAAHAGHPPPKTLKTGAHGHPFLSRGATAPYPQTVFWTCVASRRHQLRLVVNRAHTNERQT